MIKELKLLFQDFGVFLKHDFKPKVYAYVILLVSLSIILVYTTDLASRLGTGISPTPYKILNNILLFNILYFLTAVPVLILQGKYHEISKPHFYLKGILLMTAVGFADVFSWRDYISLSERTYQEQNFLLKVLWRLRNIIFVRPILILLRLFVDKKVQGLYGLCRGNHHIKAYLSLYVVVLPVLIAVSFTPDFLSYYPIGKPWIYDGLFGNRAWLNTSIFETVYMGDFVMVELFFRGALVIGMGAVMGRSAVLPMVAVYVALHFGKPAAETISAFFGGLFLGALAFQTRHIWGGVIIHMGIALVIELLRFAQHYIWGI